MGVFWHGGCGHLKLFWPLRAYSCKRTPLLKLLDPPLGASSMALLLGTKPLLGIRLNDLRMRSSYMVTDTKYYLGIQILSFYANIRMNQLFVAALILRFN